MHYYYLVLWTRNANKKSLDFISRRICMQVLRKANRTRNLKSHSPGNLVYFSFCFVFVFFRSLPLFAILPCQNTFLFGLCFQISKIQVLVYMITKISSGSKCLYRGHIFNNTVSRKLCLPIQSLSDNIVFHMELLEIDLVNWQ